MPRYRDFKNAILKDDYFSQELKGRDELLQRWFWAGVAAAVRVEEKVGNVAKPNSNAVLADRNYRIEAYFSIQKYICCRCCESTSRPSIMS